MHVLRILSVPTLDVLIPPAGTMAIHRHQRHVLFMIQLTVQERHITPITFSKEVMSLRFLNEIVAHVGKQLIIQVNQQFLRPVTTFVPICQLRIKLQQSLHIAKH
jgi:hypothetical protein